MINMMGEMYLTEKEASSRYGYSIYWFRKRRFNQQAPHYMKLKEAGRILYSLEQTDHWFKQHMEQR